jgi:hypothetical protein
VLDEAEQAGRDPAIDGPAEPDSGTLASGHRRAS